MTDPYVLNAVREICKSSDLPPDELLDELPKVIAELRADSPAKRRFLTHIQRHRPEITFCWDVERQGVCLCGPGPGRRAQTSKRWEHLYPVVRPAVVNFKGTTHRPRPACAAFPGD